jgi:fructose-specific phosphotransferase system IIC component
VLGAVAGGLLGRLTSATPPNEPQTGRVPARTDQARESSPALGTGLAFLLLGPVIAGLGGYFLLGEPVDTPYFGAVLTVGMMVGFAGFLGSLFLPWR